LPFLIFFTDFKIIIYLFYYIVYNKNMNTITHLNELTKKGFPRQVSGLDKLVKARKSKATSMVTGLQKKYVREADLYLYSDTAPPMLKNFGTYAKRGRQIYDISPEIIKKVQIEAEAIRKQKLNVLRHAFQNGVVFN